MPSPLTAIPGIELIELIGRGAHTVVWRARRRGRTYAVKVQREQDPTATQAFRGEAAILARLHHPGLSEIIEVGQLDDGRAYLVMEYVQGVTLATVLAAGPLPPPRIAELAGELGSALDEVHRFGLVHRDVKPRNILIDESSRARLIDFGLAARLADLDRSEVAGSFVYTAPEQTGMLDRPVDGRSDLYSLGVVLYECATGQPPFQAQDVGELIRMHAVSPLPDPRELAPGLSQALAGVICKLLAKDPDDRYQTGSGLCADLARLDALEASLKRGGGARLGEQDHPAIHEELPLVGRSDELETLRDAWKATALQRGGVVVIEGEAGTGKSRLAREVVRLAREQDALVLRATCSEREPVPFAPLREAFDDYAARIHRMPWEHREHHVDRALRAAGSSAPLVGTLSPELAVVLDATEVQAVDALSPEDFQRALALMLQRSAVEHSGAVFLLDNVQWLDEASLRVFARMSERLGRAPLLVVATARSEADYAPAVDRFVEAMGDVLSCRLTLSPMAENEVAQLVSEILGGGRVDPSFAQQIATRSNGNPFAVGEYVRAMLDAGLLRPSWGRWIVEPGGLDRLELPDDVLDLVVKRVDALGPDAHQVLTAAAVAGAPFDLELVAAACGVEPSAVQSAVGEAIRARIVERGPTGDYTFVHAQVAEALLAGVDEAVIRGLHQSIAELLDQRLDTDGRLTYALAHHYIHGEVSIDPQRVHQTALAAGLRARSEFAAERAWQLLIVAHEVAEEAGFRPDPALGNALGQTSAHIGRLEDATRYLKAALWYTDDNVGRARLHRALANLYLWAHIDTERAQEALHAGFFEIGSQVGKTRVGRLLASAWHFARGALARLVGAGPLKGEDLERALVSSALYSLVSGVAYFDMDPTLQLEACARQYYLSARIGPCAEQVESFQAVATACASVGFERLSEHWSERAMAVAEAIESPLSQAKAQLYRGMAMNQLGRAEEAEHEVRRVLETQEQYLETVDFQLGASDLVTNLLLRGYTREAQSWVDQARERVSGIQGGLFESHAVYIYLATIEAMLGRPAEARAALEHVDQAGDVFPKVRYWVAERAVNAIACLVEQGELGARLDEAIADFEALGIDSRFDPYHLRAGHVFRAHARAAQAALALGDERKRRIGQLRRAIARLDRVANSDVLASHRAVATGALARLEGRTERALVSLERARVLADRADCPWVSWEVLRHRAEILLEEGSIPAAVRTARAASRLASEHGWGTRLRRIRKAFDLSAVSASVRMGSGTPHNEGIKLAHHHQALMQLSIASASARGSRQLSQSALDEVVKLLGAERAFLFLSPDGGESLEFSVGRDSHRHTLPLVPDYSSTLVDTVRDTREARVVSGTDEGAELGSESAVAHGLRSIIAAPMLLRDRLIGVVYLDTRLARGVFTEEDVDILTAIANHVAVAIERARLQEEILQEEQRRLALERFHAPSVVKRLMMQQDGSQRGHADGRIVEYVEATILFCDLSDFTRFCDDHDAESIALLMNVYLGRMTEIAFAWRGTVDKYVGDSIMCIFGAPFAEGDDTLRAVQCAMDMRRAFQRLVSTGETGPGTDELTVHIGVNTGPVVVGTVGSRQRMEYTALGDTVNTAARLESFAAPNQIVIGPRTAELVREAIELRSLGEVALKGKRKTVEAFEVLGDILGDDLTDELELDLGADPDLP